MNYPATSFLFLTLTVKNVPVWELREEIRKLNEAWSRVTKLKSFPAIGYVKSVEVTREYSEGKPTNYVHPHLHVVLHVKDSYFSGRGYIKHETWVEIWQHALKVNYKPTVHIKKVKALKRDELIEEPNLDLPKKALELLSGLVEVLKYEIKSSDFEEDIEFLAEFHKQVKGSRAVSVTGSFKQFVKDTEPENPIADEIADEGIKAELELWFTFTGGRYKLLQSENGNIPLSQE